MVEHQKNQKGTREKPVKAKEMKLSAIRPWTGEPRTPNHPNTELKKRSDLGNQNSMPQVAGRQAAAGTLQFLTV